MTQDELMELLVVRGEATERIDAFSLGHPGRVEILDVGRTTQGRLVVVLGRPVDD